MASIKGAVDNADALGFFGASIRATSTIGASGR